MELVIPIFPIKLVVFPQSKYPLHIFEKRYKKLINYCLDGHTGFGIISIIGNEFSMVGTYVTINKLLKKYTTGEMDIIVEGKERFSIISYEMHADGYYTASINNYKDISTQADIILLEEMEIKFEKIIDRVSYKLEDSFWKNYRSSQLKSFKLAEKSGLSLQQQQTLLSLQNESERISFLINHFEKLEDMLTEDNALKNIIMGNGFIN